MLERTSNAAFIRFGSCALLVFGLALISLAQTNTEQKNERFGYTVIDKEGWPLPNPEVLEFQNDGKIYFDDIEVLRTNYKPTGKFESNVNLFFVDGSGALNQLRKFVDIRSVSTYSVGGKTFAYYIEHNQIGTYAEGGKAYFGPLISFSFFDEDGDGIFETRTYTGSGMIENVPGWIKELPDVKYKTKLSPSSPMPVPKTIIYAN